MLRAPTDRPEGVQLKYVRVLRTLLITFSVLTVCEGASAGGERLSRAELLKLLISNTEVGIVRRPSSAGAEGASGEGYRAYYLSADSVLYKRDSAQSAEHWDWGVRTSGALCRGPQMGIASWCRYVERLDNGRYRAVGFRSGNLRYEFKVLEGRQP